MKSKKGFPISFEQDEDGVFIVSCSNIKACHTQGKTLKKALERIEIVIEMLLEETYKVK